MNDAATERIDGRTARRERGRRAVLEAGLRLLSADGVATTEMLASEAGISTSSLFRYFDGMDELYRQMADYFAERHADLFDAVPAPGADRTDRISEFVALRLRNWETIAPLAQRVEAYALVNPEATPATTSLRRRTAEHVERFFAPELDQLTPARRIDLASTIDTLTSAEAGRILAEVHHRTQHQIRRSWMSALTILLAAEH
ncbi:MAG: helix-turn-helix domain-containing protein [Actinomycetota bacterium]